MDRCKSDARLRDRFPRRRFGELMQWQREHVIDAAFVASPAPSIRRLSCCETASHLSIEQLLQSDCNGVGVQRIEGGQQRHCACWFPSHRCTLVVSRALRWATAESARLPFCFVSLKVSSRVTRGTPWASISKSKWSTFAAQNSNSPYGTRVRRTTNEGGNERRSEE